MEVRNLSAMALLSIYENNNISSDELLKNTGLQFDYLKQVNKFHRWDQFVKMYENCSLKFGPEYTVREIGQSGLRNKEISSLVKLTTSFFDTKTIYWAMAVFGGKHLFKSCVQFKYKKLSSKQILMEITINESLRDCPLLLESYIHVFENIPTVLSLDKAMVTAEIMPRNAKYYISFANTSYFKLFLNSFNNLVNGYRNTLSLMGEIENQSTELSRIIEEKSKLIRILGHDIANQVTIIDYYLNKMNNRKLLDSDDSQSIQFAINSANVLRDILYNIQNMEVSNLKGLKLIPVNLEELFLSIAKNNSKDLTNKKIVLKFENNSKNALFVLADRVSLEFNVLGNLINNAIKFSPDNSEIIFKVQEYQNKILISIIDFGIGMDMATQEYLFNDRMRTSTTGTNGENGSGLGLGIVKNYLRLMKGDIKVHSNYPKGTIFTIELEASK